MIADDDSGVCDLEGLPRPDTIAATFARCPEDAAADARELLFVSFAGVAADAARVKASPDSIRQDWELNVCPALEARLAAPDPSAIEDLDVAAETLRVWAAVAGEDPVAVGLEALRETVRALRGPAQWAAVRSMAAVLVASGGLTPAEANRLLYAEMPGVLEPVR